MKDRATPLCFIIYANYGGIGGALTRFRAEVEYFAMKGHPVNVVYASAGGERAFRRGNICFHGIRRIRKAYFIYQVRLFFWSLRQIQREPGMIFIAHDPLSLAPLAMLRFLGVRPKSFLVMHGPMAVESYMRGNIGRAWVSAFIDHLVLKKADGVIAVSEYEKKYALACGVDPQRVVIIRNGVENKKLVKNTSFRDEIGIPPDSVIIGYLGTADPYRGINFLLEGFARAKSVTSTSIALILIFRDDLTEAQKADLLNRYKLDGGVYISKPRKDFLNVLASLDIYASHFTKKVDGIGFAIMEAMSNAIPVITGKDYITNTILRDGVDAILVNKEDAEEVAKAIKILAEDPGLREKLGKNARETAVSRLSNAYMLQQCEREYLGGDS